MSGDKNAKFMKKFVEFINSTTEERAHELVSPDAIFHVPGRPEPLVGPAGYLLILGMMREGFSDIQWTAEELGPVDKRASQITRVLIQGFLLEGGRLGSRGFVGFRMGGHRAIAAL